MKRIVIILIFILFLPGISKGQMYYLKLRASHHPGFLRMVLEGEQAIIGKAMVYQRGTNILVKFPDMNFLIQEESVPVTFSKIDRNTIMLYPGDFRGLKVFTLKHPVRLVIDVYLKEKAEQLVPVIPPSEAADQTGPVKITTVIVDPGHGGYEYGLVKDAYIEKNIVLDIAKKLSSLINGGSSQSLLTRGSDRLLTPKERIAFAKDKEADIFISLHIGNHSDVVIYIPVITERVPDDIKPYLDNKGQEDYMRRTIALLNAMKEALVDDFGQDMVSVRPLPYSMLSHIEAAALMIELPSFADAHYIEELKKKMAGSLYKGLYFYEEIKGK